MTKQIDFASPPIHEVVFGMNFEHPVRMKSAHFGSFWETIKQRFPTTQDQVPIVSPGETPDPDQPLARVWFISRDDASLVQLQQDRMLLNWRRLDQDALIYPEYTNLLPTFLGLAGELNEFFTDASLSQQLRASQLELTYINVVDRPDFWSNEEFFNSFLVDHSRAAGNRFLPSPRDFSWNTAYDLPSGRGTLVVEAKSGNRIDDETKRIVQLNLTARSALVSLTASDNDMRRWFDEAHEAIVKGFADITNSRMQNSVWMRK